MGAQDGFDSEDSGGASSSDESAVDYYNLKMAVFQENMTAVDREIRELEMGTHKGYLEETARLEQERELRVQDAELYHSFRKECVQKWLEEGTAEVVEQCEREMEEVQAQMIEEVQERKRRLEEERNSNDLVEDSPAVINRKSVRGKRVDVKEKATQQEKAANAKRKNRMQVPSGPKVTLRLKESDIAEDMLLVTSRQARAEKARTTGNSKSRAAASTT